MNTKHAKILVVDDEKEIRQMLSRHFRFMDYTVETAENGLDALEKMNKERFEVVITDIMMPKMNGLELLKTIRDEFPMTRAIVITGYVTMFNLLAAMRYGADTCIFKPLNDMTELEEAVQCRVEHLLNWQNKMKELIDMKLDKEI